MNSSSLPNRTNQLEAELAESEKRAEKIATEIDNLLYKKYRELNLDAGRALENEEFEKVLNLVSKIVMVDEIRAEITKIFKN